MIPPQALNAVGLALAKAAAWGVAQLASRAIDGGFSPDISRLSRLDERSLLVEIALRDNAGVVSGPAPAPDEATTMVKRGQATVDRLLPRARALICPHREEILKVAGSPEVVVIGSVAGFLMGGLPGALVNPLAALLVKRGIPALCGG